MSIMFIVTSPIFCSLKCRRSVTETCDIEGNGVEDAERGLEIELATVDDLTSSDKVEIQ